MKIEDIEVFEVNSVAKAQIQIIIKRVISFLEDIKILRFSPITCDKPEFYYIFLFKENQNLSNILENLLQ